MQAVLLAALFALSLSAGERPYFITYNHHMEEPGSLEISLNPVLGAPRTAPSFAGAWTEFEYGAKGWWTTELYLDGQATRGEASVFTGYRWENRFRPLMREHWINPVLYVEFEDLNGADKTLKDVVGHDSVDGFVTPNRKALLERKREIETKLIFSSNVKGWNLAENFIAEKNLANGPWEFGYAAGVSRPLALAAKPQACSFCRENFAAGIELYGGLGDWRRFGFPGTSHYLAPVLAWELANGASFRISPSFGLSNNSHPLLLRFGVSYEFSNFGKGVRQWLRR